MDLVGLVKALASLAPYLENPIVLFALGVLLLVGFGAAVFSQRPGLAVALSLIGGLGAMTMGVALVVAERYRETTVSLGTRTIEQSTTINARRIRLEPGAKIRVMHGASLVLSANRIDALGPVQFDGTGDEGARGTPGRRGSDATLLPADREVWISGAGGGRNATSWYENARGSFHPHNSGGKGGVGQRGGPGAKILFVLKEINGKAQISCNAPGGPGGTGGEGGPGRIHINGDNHSMRFEGSKGPVGDRGPQGVDGGCVYVKRDDKAAK